MLELAIIAADGLATVSTVLAGVFGLDWAREVWF